MHSVLGAFGLNSSVYDAANLSWKLGLCLGGAADPRRLLPTYDAERRLFANRVIRCSGAYLRFICNLDLPLAALRGLGDGDGDDGLEEHDEGLPVLDGSTDTDRRWLADFFGRNAMFLLGVDGARVPTVVSPEVPASPSPSPSPETTNGEPVVAASGRERRRGRGRPVSVCGGVRAPDPRVCLGDAQTGRLYDAMPGVARFHVLVFGSDLRGPVRQRLARFSEEGLAPGAVAGAGAGAGTGGFFSRFGGRRRFNVVLVAKCVPREADELLRAPGLENLREAATVVYDDRQPDEDAHYWYGVNHARGAIVVVRPDLVVGTSAWPEDTGAIEDYLSGFLIETHPGEI